MIYHAFTFVYKKSKMIPGSIRTFWYKGAAENKAEHKNRLVNYSDLTVFYTKSKMIPGSIRTFWYKGLVENKDKLHVREKAYISQK